MKPNDNKSHTRFHVVYATALLMLMTGLVVDSVLALAGYGTPAALTATAIDLSALVSSLNLILLWREVWSRE